MKWSLQYFQATVSLLFCFHKTFEYHLTFTNLNQKIAVTLFSNWQTEWLYWDHLLFKGRFWIVHHLHFIFLKIVYLSVIETPIYKRSRSWLHLMHSFKTIMTTFWRWIANFKKTAQFYLFWCNAVSITMFFYIILFVNVSYVQ